MAVRLPSRTGRALFVDHVSPQTRMLEKRRQVFEVEEALEAQKEEASRREEAYKRREAGLRRKDTELQEAFIRFNAIIAENEAKKGRAERKMAEEAAATVRKEADAAEAAATLRTLRQEVAGLSVERARLERYHRFLDAFFRAHAEEYAASEVVSILERYRTLHAAHDDLLAEQMRLMAAMEEERRALARARKAFSTQQLTSENAVSQLKAQLEALRAVTQALAAGAEDSTAQKGRRVLVLGQVLQCVYNLHARCTGSKHGGIIRHTPADGEVLGYGAAIGSGGDGGGGGDDDDGGGSGSDGEGDGSHAGSPVRAGDRRRSLSPAPSPPSSPPSSPDSPGAASSPRKRKGADGGGGGDGATAPASLAAPGAGFVAADAEKLSMEALGERLRQAVALLHVVGSYIIDFESIVSEYPAWFAEQRRKQAERDASIQTEAKRLAAARLARTGGSLDRAGRGRSSPGGGGDMALSRSERGAAALLSSSAAAAAAAAAAAPPASGSGGAADGGRGSVAGASRASGVIIAGAGAASVDSSAYASSMPDSAVAPAPAATAVTAKGAGSRIYVTKGAVLSPDVAHRIAWETGAWPVGIGGHAPGSLAAMASSGPRRSAHYGGMPAYASPPSGGSGGGRVATSGSGGRPGRGATPEQPQGNRSVPMRPLPAFTLSDPSRRHSGVAAARAAASGAAAR